jgi:hypothetical protein
VTLFVRNLDQSHERRFNGPNPIQRNKSLPDGSPKLSPSDVASLHLADKRAIAVMYSTYPGTPDPAEPPKHWPEKESASK